MLYIFSNELKIKVTEIVNFKLLPVIVFGTHWSCFFIIINQIAIRLCFMVLEDPQIDVVKKNTKTVESGSAQFPQQTIT